MKEERYHIALDDYEHGVVIRALNDTKTDLMNEGKSTDAVDDLMFIFVVISGVLIEPTGLDAEIDQFVVDFSAAQIFDGVGGAVVGQRQKQHLFF